MSTAEVVSFIGAKPVFVDIDETTYNIDPAGIEAVITDRTKGIIPVDLFGLCADYDAINAVASKHGLFVIEDAAQSLGAEYKGRRACSLAEQACTSFFPAKPFGCYGDGGMVLTDCDELADIHRSLHVHGKGDNKYDNIRIGVNSRLDTIQAAIMLAKLPHFEDEIRMRQEVAARYATGLGQAVVTPCIPDDCLSVYAQYCVLCVDRDGTQAALKEADIPSAIYYPTPLHLQTAYQYLGCKQGDFPVSERIADCILALPMHPFMTEEDQQQVIGAIV